MAANVKCGLKSGAVVLLNMSADEKFFFMCLSGGADAYISLRVTQQRCSIDQKECAGWGGK